MNLQHTKSRRTLLGLWAISWRIGLFFVSFGVFSALLVLPVASRLPEWEQRFPVGFLLFTGAAAAGTLLLATWTMTRFVDRRPFQSIGFRFDRVLRELAGGLLLGTGWIAASLGVLWVLGWVAPSAGVTSAVQPPASGTGLALAGTALAVLLNVLGQQLLLCGYILQTIQQRANFIVALLASSALFSVYHAGAFQGGWLPPVNVFLAGVVFCLAYGMTGNLWLPTAIHFAWNFLLGPVLGLTVSGSGDLTAAWAVLEIEGPDRFTGGAFGLEGGLVVTLTTAVLVFALAAILRRCSLAAVVER